MGQAQVPEPMVVELRERLVATVSHEFRTPLTVIQASAGLIRQRVASLDLDARDLKRLLGSCARIEEATENMVGVIERVLLIGRISAGEEPYNPRATVPGDVLMSLAADLPARGQPPREVVLDVQQAQVHCHLDPLVLRQVATQLLDNALKYSAPDSVVELHARCDAQYLHLRVRDHGIGMSASEVAWLFEPFHRGAAVRDVPGMGLGLALVRQLLRLADGRIEIESTLNVGTTVHVSLPLATATKEPPP